MTNEKSNILRAEVATVKIGLLEVEGLKLENGADAIALQQVTSLFQLLPNSTQKWLETNLGKGCSFYRVKTNREKVESKRVRSTENALSLIDFEKLLRKLDRKGNKLAQELVDDLIGLSLKQLWADAFGEKFEKEERQQWLITRQKNKDSFWLYSDAIKNYLDGVDISDNERKWVYPNCQDCINRTLFGLSAKQIREKLNVSDLLRDHYGKQALAHIESVQRLACRLIEKGTSPLNATKEALSTFDYPIVNYHD